MWDKDLKVGMKDLLVGISSMRLCAATHKMPKEKRHQIEANWRHWLIGYHQSTRPTATGCSKEK